MNHILLAFALSGSLLSLPKIYGKSEADYDDTALGCRIEDVVEVSSDEESNKAESGGEEN